MKVYCLYCGNILKLENDTYICDLCGSKSKKEEVRFFADMPDNFELLTENLIDFKDRSKFYLDFVQFNVSNLLNQLSYKLNHIHSKVVNPIKSMFYLMDFVKNVEEKEFEEVYNEILDIGKNEILNLPIINKPNFEECAFELILKAYTDLSRLRFQTVISSMPATHFSIGLKRVMSCIWIAYYLYLNKPVENFNIEDLKQKLENAKIC